MVTHSSAETEQRGTVQLHGHAHRDAHKCQPLAMARDVAVALLDGLRQGKQRSLGFIDRELARVARTAPTG
jgi:hypothetical protein